MSRPGLNHGPYLVAGARVWVRDPAGDCTGVIRAIGVGPGAIAQVAVVDPGGVTGRRPGQLLAVPWQRLGVHR